MSPELSRPLRVDTLGATPRSLSVEADAQERAALAERFGIPGIENLAAEVELTLKGEAVIVAGTLKASVTQSCVATGVPVPERVDEPFTVLLRPRPEAGAEEEIELSEGELDVVFYEGAAVDVGEVVAETLSLALEPYPRSPEAAAALKEAGVLSEEEAKPASPLAGLKACSPPNHEGPNHEGARSGADIGAGPSMPPPSAT